MPDRTGTRRRRPPEGRRAGYTLELALDEAAVFLARYDVGIIQAAEPIDVLRDLVRARHTRSAAPRPVDARNAALVELLRDRGPMSLRAIQRALGGTGRSGGTADIAARLRELARRGEIAKIAGGRGGGG